VSDSAFTSPCTASAGVSNAVESELMILLASIVLAESVPSTINASPTVTAVESGDVILFVATESDCTVPVTFIPSLKVTTEESPDSTVLIDKVSPSKFATMVALAVSVTEVAVAFEVDVTALNLSSPSFQ